MNWRWSTASRPNILSQTSVRAGQSMRTSRRSCRESLSVFLVSFSNYIVTTGTPVTQTLFHHAVNNVGKMYEYPDDVHNVPEDTLWDILNINVGACTILTRMVVPGMIQRKRGAIVNISSGSELQPVPYMATYGATKAYIRNFTLAIQEELERFGITVQLVSPMFLVTKMNAFSERVMSGGLLIPSVESYTKSMLFTLGKTSRTNGWWSHSVQYAAMKIVPERIRIKVGAVMNREFRTEFQENQKRTKSS